MTHEERIRSLQQELLALKAELRKTKGAYKRAVLMEEIRAVCRELARLQENP